MNQESSRSLAQRRYSFFKSIENDQNFIEFILEPLKNKHIKYTSILKHFDSKIDDVYRAQGALDVLDYFHNLFRIAEEIWEEERKIGE